MRIRVHLVAVVVSVMLGHASQTLAQPGEESVPETPPTPSPEPPPTPAVDAPPVTSPQPTTELPDWNRRLAIARDLLLAGRRDEARKAYAELAADARTDIGRAVAREGGVLADMWPADAVIDNQGKVIKNADVRTSLEIAGLYLSAVGYGLGSGITLAIWTKPDSAAEAIFPTLGLIGASAGAVYALDRNVNLGYGVPQSISTGMLVGLAHGFAWTFWNQASVGYRDEWSEEAIATVLWGSATAGAVLGGVLGNADGTTPGRASLIGSASIWTGLVTGLIAGGLDSTHPDDTGMLASALGLTVGAFGGHLLGRAESPSAARVRYMDLGAVCGGLAAGGVYMGLADDNLSGRSLALVTAAGIVVGAAVAYRATDDMEQDLPRGQRGRSQADTAMTPTIAPVADGQGATVGLAGTF